MFITVHATVGAIIGEQTNNIWVALVLGFLSHFVFDAIPHGDQNLLDKEPTKKSKAAKFFKFFVLDALVLSAAFSLYFNFHLFDNWLPVLAGAFGAILPDGISGLNLILPRSPAWMRWVYKKNRDMHYIFNGFTIQFPAGLAVQFITMIGLIAVILLM